MFRFVTMITCYQIIARLPAFLVFTIVDFLIGDFEGAAYIQGFADCSEVLDVSEIEVKLWRFYASYTVTEGDPRLTISIPRNYVINTPF